MNRNSLQATVLTLFPEMFPGPLGFSLTGKALESGIWSLDTINIRDFGLTKHQTVDDTPYGGGAGMVMRADVVDAAITEGFRWSPGATLVYLTPRGVPFDQDIAAELVFAERAPHPNPLPREKEYDSVSPLTPLARRLRKNQTDVEHVLWFHLRNRHMLGLKFRRQHPIEHYIVDFFCEEIGLIIELDGGQHNEEKHLANDNKRTELLETKGFKVLRFWNNDILENLEGVLTTIYHTAEAMISPLPGERVRVRGEATDSDPSDEAPIQLIFLCGRFESIDERVISKYQPLEISLGDFVLTGGELAAMTILDACVRLLPGVIGEPESLAEESFGMSENYALLLEHPHYTKPPVWEGNSVPDILLSGNHAKIARWRLEESEKMTKNRRPDLWERYRKKGTED